MVCALHSQSHFVWQAVQSLPPDENTLGFKLNSPLIPGVSGFDYLVVIQTIIGLVLGLVVAWVIPEVAKLLLTKVYGELDAEANMQLMRLCIFAGEIARIQRTIAYCAHFLCLALHLLFGSVLPDLVLMIGIPLVVTILLHQVTLELALLPLTLLLLSLYSALQKDCYGQWLQLWNLCNADKATFTIGIDLAPPGWNSLNYQVLKQSDVCQPKYGTGRCSRSAIGSIAELFLHEVLGAIALLPLSILIHSHPGVASARERVLKLIWAEHEGSNEVYSELLEVILNLQMAIILGAVFPILLPLGAASIMLTLFVFNTCTNRFRCAFNDQNLLPRLGLLWVSVILGMSLCIWFFYENDTLSDSSRYIVLVGLPCSVLCGGGTGCYYHGRAIMELRRVRRQQQASPDEAVDEEKDAAASYSCDDGSLDTVFQGCMALRSCRASGEA